MRGAPFRRERGEVVPWVVVVPLLFFVFFFGAVYLHLDRVRACAAMAAREGAREYGVLLGKSLPATVSPELVAKARVLDVLIREGVLPPGSAFLPPGQAPPEGRRGASAEFRLAGDWVTCTVTFYLPSPLPGLPKVLYGAARPPEGPWWRSKGHFVFQVRGAAKKEIKV